MEEEKVVAAEMLLKLLRLALGKEADNALLHDVPWGSVLELADAQGVAAIAADGVEKADAEIPFSIKMEWASRMVAHEQIYSHHQELMAKLSKVYRKGGFRMMVLKGWGLSLNYPIPCHRPSGDLDIWNFGQWKEADAYIALRGVEIDNGHHHHNVFYVEDLMVENHYDFINIHAHRSSKRIEKKLKELANQEYEQRMVKGVEVYTPCATFNALFLLRHTAQHFAGSEMTLRQILDWALFLEKHQTAVNWSAIIPIIKREKMWRFFNLLNLIAVEELGFDGSIVPYEMEEDEMLERVWDDVINPGGTLPTEGSVFTVITGKLLRWWHNRWKHQLCYSDSLLSDFLFGLWAKLLKPRHFID